MNKNEKIMLWVMFVLLVIFRIYPLSLPAWYEKELVQTHLAENLANNHFNIFQSKLYFNLWFLDSHHELPIRWSEEFPLFHTIAAVGIKLVPLDPILVGRILSFIFFGLACFFLFQFVKEKYSERVAMWALFLFALSPITLAYSTYFIADSALCSFFCMAIWSLKRNYILALLSTIGFVTTRYYGVFLLLPLAGLWLSDIRTKNIKFFVLFLLPPFLEGLWLIYTLLAFEHPIGAKYHWGEWKKYLWESAFYYEEMFLRLSKYSVTFLGFLFLVIGILKSYKDWFLVGGAIMILLSLGVLTHGHDIHLYYEFNFIPFLVILAALGLVFILKKIKYSFIVSVCLIIGFTVLSFRQAYKLMRFDSSPKILGEKVQAFSKSEDKLVVIQDVPDPGVFVYGKRHGWMVDFEILKKRDELNLLLAKAQIGVVRVSEGNLLKHIDKTLPAIASLKQKHLTLWEHQAPLGRHEKCGMLNFFFNRCPRENYYLLIFKL